MSLRGSVLSSQVLKKNNTLLHSKRRLELKLKFILTTLTLDLLLKDPCCGLISGRIDQNLIHKLKVIKNSFFFSELGVKGYKESYVV